MTRPKSLYIWLHSQIRFSPAWRDPLNFVDAGLIFRFEREEHRERVQMRLFEICLELLAIVFLVVFIARFRLYFYDQKVRTLRTADVHDDVGINSLRKSVGVERDLLAAARVAFAVVLSVG